MKQTIYKKDTTGKLRYVTIWTEGSSINQKSGVLGSLKSVPHCKIAKAKNVGRSNETTPEQQAVLEVKSFLKNKLTKGYFLSVDEARDSNVILPMLAKDYFAESHKIKYGKDLVVSQPKLDGMRCLAFVSANGDVKLLSREGKTIENMMHIEKELSTIGRDIILDGELYVYGEIFQTNMSYIKKYREGKTERIQLHLYDVVSEEQYLVRYSTIRLLTEQFNFKHLVLVPLDPIYDEKDLEANFIRYTNDGYEGAMVKISKSGYKSNARSSELLKYKNFIDIQLPILDIIPSDQRPDWGQPIYYWKGAKDDTLGSGTKMTHKQREDLLTNKQDYIGKVAEIRFFEYSDIGVPRFPVTVGIRLDKSV